MFKRKPCDVLTIVTSDFDMINKNIGQKCLFSFVNCRPIRTEQNHFNIVKYDKKKNNNNANEIKHKLCFV